MFLRSPDACRAAFLSLMNKVTCCFDRCGNRVFVSFSIIILAGGRGTRMGGTRHKVLHELAGKPLIAHVLAIAQQLQPDALHVVCGYADQQVRAAVETYAGDNSRLVFHHQAEQLGTAHAVGCAAAALDTRHVLIMYGDVPILRVHSLQRLRSALGTADMVVLTASVADPYGYGRIVRDNKHRIVRVVEEKDATPAEKHIREIHTGVICARGVSLRRILPRIDHNNAAGEYHLGDGIADALHQNMTVNTLMLGDASEIQGVNTFSQLQLVERLVQQRHAADLMRRGCRLQDAARIDIRGDVAVENDVAIDANVLLEGYVALSSEVHIGANCVIRNAVIGAGTAIHPFTIIENSKIGKRCQIGPYARIRPETVLGDAVRIGNFVEVKKSHIQNASKVNHLSYIGDSSIGKHTNIGAGTITCNYDGMNKHHTIIGDHVFVGSGTQIVAPLTIHDHATIAAGSTLTKDAKTNALTLSRARQQTIDNWCRPTGRKK